MNWPLIIEISFQRNSRNRKCSQGMLKHLKKHCRKRPKLLEGVSLTEEEDDEEEEENLEDQEIDFKDEFNNETLTNSIDAGDSQADFGFIAKLETNEEKITTGEFWNPKVELKTENDIDIVNHAIKSEPIEFYDNDETTKMNENYEIKIEPGINIFHKNQNFSGIHSKISKLFQI